MNDQRHQGFVLGYDRGSDNHMVWKVRVKDSASRYDGQKLIVASTNNGLELARGLNVNFMIGTIDNSRNGKDLRAVDVRLESPGAKSNK
jgi:hypothetical protein